MTEPTFASLGLPDLLVQTLVDLGYEAPTPIQAKTIPSLLAGKDIIGQAQTGTGKTAAFSLPMLARLDLAKKKTQALILTPTRELAMQVAEAMHTYAKRLGTVSILPVYGGAPIVLQMKHLQRGAQVVVGTPGRLIDHLDRGTLDLGEVKMLVLDEADEMLKMGFIEEVERMLSLVPKPRQVALFSATMPEPIARIAQKHLVDPVRVEIEHRGLAAPAIEQRFLNVSEGQKLEVLTQILEIEPAEAVLIFRRTKNGAAELAEKLEARGFSALAMHGDMKQAEREGVIRRLRAGQIEIVVATDVAARGLDVEQISHVINYDVPNDVEAYVHRIGRTGRAGRSGVATLFITPRERRMMREIEHYTRTQIKPMKMPTPADVAVSRISTFKDALRRELKEGDLDLYVEVVTQLAEEGPFDMADIAAASARIANGARSLAAPAPIPVTAYEPARSSGSPAREQRSFSPSHPPGSGAEVDPDKVRLSMALGKRDGIRPADVVGSIANEAGVPGRDIGPIEIRDDVTFVVVPRQYLDQVLEKVGRAKFKGRSVDIKVATGQSQSSGGRPPFSEDRSSGRPPSRGTFKPGGRPDGPARRKEYTPRGETRDSRPSRAEGRPPFQKDRAPGKPDYKPRPPADRPSPARTERPPSAPPRSPFRTTGMPTERKPGVRPSKPGAFDRFSKGGAKPFGKKPGGKRK